MTQESDTLSLDVRAHSEVGLVRKNNQDSGYASPNLLVVADGMGGAAAGDLASAVAIDEVAKIDQRLSGEAMLTAFAGAVVRADQRISDLIAADPALDGMGTTVSGLMFSGRELGLVHIGDSRAYRYRDGQLQRLTHDHSWVQSLIDEGRISEDEADVHPHRSLILKVVNGQGVHDPDTELLDVADQDLLLVCSDGLCGFVSDDRIAATLAGGDLDQAMTELIEQAHAEGGSDNITIVLARVVPRSTVLDSRPAEVLGAAVDTDLFPEPAPPTKADRARQRNREEQDRYAPTLTRRRRWVAPLVVGLVLALIAGIALGAWAYSRTLYFLGDSNSMVGIYNGIPGGLGPVALSSPVETSNVRIEDLPRYYRTQVLSNQITVHSLAEARLAVAALELKAEECAQQASPPPPTSVAPPPSSTPPASTPPVSSPPVFGSPSSASPGSVPPNSTSPRPSASASASPNSAPPSSILQTSPPAPPLPTTPQECE